MGLAEGRVHKIPWTRSGCPSEEMCAKLLEEKGVLFSSGTFFGLENRLRINSGLRKGLLDESLKRVNYYVGRHVATKGFDASKMVALT